jgi:hypothetical protein
VSTSSSDILFSLEFTESQRCSWGRTSGVALPHAADSKGQQNEHFKLGEIKNIKQISALNRFYIIEPNERKLNKY